MSRALFLAALVALSGCNRPAAPDPTPLASGTHKPASASAAVEFDAAAYVEHIKVLSSDEFEGRGPSSLGEEKTVAYLEQQFKTLGLEPGNGDSFFQNVPLVTITAEPAPVVIRRDGVPAQVMEYGPDAVIWTKRVTASSALHNSEVLFVGYGIVAPEFDWNDYANVDVRGKTVVILVNDPGFATQDPDVFKGNAMTYYGRWTYKFEEAARQGAAGALIVHETRPAAYPWDVVEGSWTGPQHDLVSADKNASRAAVEGWISQQQAQALFENAGMDYQAAKERALAPDFEATPLGLTASASLVNDIKVADSKNVLARLPGSKRPDEHIVFFAHWDHLGKDDKLPDPIYNGAVDNATGTAALLTLAAAFKRAPVAPERSLLFVAVTAEESGLLGSRHYGENPVFPLNKTVAGINMDALNVAGRTRDISVIGYGSSELEKYLAEAASGQGRVIVPEPTPEKGFFYRSDHFNLAKKGVPMLYAKGGSDHIVGGKEAGRRAAQDYTTNRYHKPSDEYSDDWVIEAALDDIALYYAVAARLAGESHYVNWYPGTEFRGIRDQSMAAP